MNMNTSQKKVFFDDTKDEFKRIMHQDKIRKQLMTERNQNFSFGGQSKLKGSLNTNSTKNF